MSRELSKNLMCILMRNGLEIWKEEERLSGINFEGVKFVNIDGEKINTADVSGIFNSSTMEDYTRRKNGMWKCKFNNWHNKSEFCSCRPPKKCARCGKLNPSSWVDASGGVCGECFN